MGKKGGGGSTSYVQSPEARQIMQSLMPMFDMMVKKGLGGQPLWDVPDMPSSATTYDVPGYDVPNLTLGGLPSEVKKSFMAPYLEGEKQMLHTIGQGGGGSAMGGFSGPQAASIGQYWGQASPAYSQSLFQAAQPMWQAGVGRNRDIWGGELGRNIFGAQQAGEGWKQRLGAIQAPFSIFPGMLGESMPSPVVEQGGKK